MWQAFCYTLRVHWLLHPKLCVCEAYSLDNHNSAILGKQKGEKYILSQISDHRPLHMH